MNEKLKKLASWLVQAVRLLFIQPFVWFFSLTLKKKLLVTGLGLLSGILLLVSFPIWLYFTVKGGAFGKMPTDADLQDIKSFQASEVYSADSVLLGRYFVMNRSDATYEQVNPSLFQAIIAIEDARFYEHKGVDSRSLLRVLFKSIMLGKKSGGGSTLSQQLVKNVFGREKHGLLTMPVTKIKEAIIANQFERLYSKKDILMLYINTVSFGEDTYGIKTASQRFFSTTPDQLTVPQSATLAGMLKSPTAYNPRKNPNRSIERRNLVIHQMGAHGDLSQKEVTYYSNTHLGLNYKRLEHYDGLAPYFREKVRQEVETWLAQHPKEDGSTYNIYSDGLKIFTSLHSKLQQYAEQAVEEHLARIQPSLHSSLKANRFFKSNYGLIVEGIKKTSRYQHLQEKGLKHEEIVKELQKPVKTTLFTQSGEKVIEISPMDSVKWMISSLQSAFLVTNPKNGQILAYVGGPNFEYFQYDHIMAQRQVGSTFKPIVYAEALRDGTQPCDFIPNQKITYSQYDNWTPQNSEDNYGGKYSVAGAFANSVNTISVQLCMKSGIKKVIGLARSLGIKSELPEKPAVALGAADLTLWELLGAYTAFANAGIKTEWQFLSSIQTKDGTLLFKAKSSKATRVLSTDIAQQMTNMMRNVTIKGTGYEMRERYGFTGDIAGKTGTTQDHRDGWFVGYTARMLAGVWVGADNPAIHFTNMEQGKGSRLAMPIWANFYKRVIHDKSTRYLAASFPFENNIDCEMKKEDGFWGKLFRRKEKSSDQSGFERQPTEKSKKKGFNWFRKRK